MQLATDRPPRTFAGRAGGVTGDGGDRAGASVDVESLSSLYVTTAAGVEVATAAAAIAFRADLIALERSFVCRKCARFALRGAPTGFGLRAAPPPRLGCVGML